jgi:heme A synthase
MLLFLSGVDLPTILVLFTLLVLFAWVMFRLFRRLLRATFRTASRQKVSFWSAICAVVFSPALVAGGLVLLVNASMDVDGSPETSQGSERHQYRLMERDISKKLAPGMSKKEVVAIFGDSDTTQSVVVYDLSLPGAEKKYLLEITFDKHGLKEFQRQR